MTARKISKAEALHALSGNVLPKLRKRPQIQGISKYKKGLLLQNKCKQTNKLCKRPEKGISAAGLDLT
jgi:hypothetical protein